MNHLIIPNQIEKGDQIIAILSCAYFTCNQFDQTRTQLNRMFSGKIFEVKHFAAFQRPQILCAQSETKNKMN